METRNSKAADGGGVSAASQDSAKINLQKNNSRGLATIQPGTALTAFLKRYKFDLLLLPYDRHISALVDCCDFILEADRGQS